MQLDSTKLLLHLLRQCGLVDCSTAAQQKHWTLNDVITYVHEIKREKASYWNAANYYSLDKYCFNWTGNTLPMGPLTAFQVRLYHRDPRHGRHDRHDSKHGVSVWNFITYNIEAIKISSTSTWRHCVFDNTPREKQHTSHVTLVTGGA